MSVNYLGYFLWIFKNSIDVLTYLKAQNFYEINGVHMYNFWPLIVLLSSERIEI
jgi:hypothetical protein